MRVTQPSSNLPYNFLSGEEGAKLHPSSIVANSSVMETESIPKILREYTNIANKLAELAQKEGGMGSSDMADLKLRELRNSQSALLKELADMAKNGDEEAIELIVQFHVFSMDDEVSKEVDAAIRKIFKAQPDLVAKMAKKLTLCTLRPAEFDFFLFENKYTCVIGDEETGSPIRSTFNPTLMTPETTLKATELWRDAAGVTCEKAREEVRQALQSDPDYKIKTDAETVAEEAFKDAEAAVAFALYQLRGEYIVREKAVLLPSCEVLEELGSVETNLTGEAGIIGGDEAGQTSEELIEWLERRFVEENEHLAELLKEPEFE